MSLAPAFAQVEAYNRAAVEANTWGHLAPQPGIAYKVSVLFCNSEYQYQIPIKVETDDLPDSPWFYEDMQDMINDAETEAGCVYKFTGSYKKFKNGNCRWSGKIVKVV